MVQDYTAPVREYDYAFEYVMEAYEKRFGENGCPDIPIIKKLGMIFELRIVQDDYYCNGNYGQFHHNLSKTNHIFHYNSKHPELPKRKARQRPFFFKNQKRYN